MLLLACKGECCLLLFYIDNLKKILVDLFIVLYIYIKQAI